MINRRHHHLESHQLPPRMRPYLLLEHRLLLFFSLIRWHTSNNKWPPSFRSVLLSYLIMVVVYFKCPMSAFKVICIKINMFSLFHIVLGKSTIILKFLKLRQSERATSKKMKQQKQISETKLDIEWMNSRDCITKDQTLKFISIIMSN